MPRWIRPAAVESLSLAIVTAIHVLLTLHLQDLHPQETSAWISLIVSSAPVVLAYALLRVALPPAPVASITCSALIVLGVANHVKMSLTGEPLSWTDLSTSANISVINHYLTASHILLLSGIVAAVTVAFMANPVQVRLRTTIIAKIALLAISAPIALYPYLDFVDDRVARAMSRLLGETGIRYIPWDWPQNVRMNGLPLHLVHTSRRTIPRTPSAPEVAAFQSLLSAPSFHLDRPRNVVFILCEACWHDERNFRDIFRPLELLGLRQLRATSPTYGGGTVNASFELLTGLPASGALNGVIYQEYAHLISDDAYAWPRQLARIGYKTVFAHNHLRKFWQRDIVKPKLGFELFLGIEDMEHDGSPGWADDSFLLDAAARELHKHYQRHNFLYLTTVFTHGGYAFEGDYGQRDYARRLRTTIKRISTFIADVQRRYPDLLVIVAADHKPAMTKFFHASGVFNDSQFESVGERNEDFRFAAYSSRELRGDVPIYIHHRDERKVDRVIERASRLPFFCLAYIIDDEFTKSGVPAFQFAGEQGICDRYAYGGYEDAVKAYPDWLYALSILEANRMDPIARR